MLGNTDDHILWVGAESAQERPLETEQQYVLYRRNRGRWNRSLLATLLHLIHKQIFVWFLVETCWPAHRTNTGVTAITDQHANKAKVGRRTIC